MLTLSVSTIYFLDKIPILSARCQKITAYINVEN